MERLTERRNGRVGFTGNGTPTENMHKIPAVLDRLAAYEDTGLEPEEMPTALELADIYAALQLLKQYEECGPIDHLRDLATAHNHWKSCGGCPIPDGVTDDDVRIALQLLTAEREGKLAVLPCAAHGADLFFVDRYRQEIYKEAYTAGICLSWANHSDLGDCLPLSVIGKTVFLTREEAEAALEKGAHP